MKESESKSDLNAQNSKSLSGFKVAILCTDGVEQAELLEPRKALEAAGATVTLVSPKKDSVQGMVFKELGKTIPVDLQLTDADAEDFDALVLPGGVANPDDLRIDTKAVDFIRAIVDAGKPVAAICHGPWTLIEVDFVRGKNLTSWPSLKTDLTNAGANWTDASVVVSEGLVTSRKPDDLPDFNREMIQLFALRPQAQTAARRAIPRMIENSPPLN